MKVHIRCTHIHIHMPMFHAPCIARCTCIARQAKGFCVEMQNARNTKRKCKRALSLLFSCFKRFWHGLNENRILWGKKKHRMTRVVILWGGTENIVFNMLIFSPFPWLSIYLSLSLSSSAFAFHLTRPQCLPAQIVCEGIIKVYRSMELITMLCYREWCREEARGRKGKQKIERETKWNREKEGPKWKM